MEPYERLAIIREERGYSVEQIAKMLHTTAATVRKWESGERKMRFSKYIFLAELYNIRLDYIVGIIDEPEKLRP